MSYMLDLLGTQINNILNGVHSVAGLVFRAGEQSYRPATASDIVTALLNGQLTETEKQQMRDLLGVSTNGLMILGHVSSSSQLPTTENRRGDAYSVGTSTPYNLYFWDGSAWFNNGPISTTVNWGNIAGTLSGQTDLASALNNKQDKLNLTGLLRGNGTSGVTGSSVGTSDIASGAVTSTKIASGAVAAANIQDGAVSFVFSPDALLATDWTSSTEAGGGVIQEVEAELLTASDNKFFVDLDASNYSTDLAVINARKAYGKIVDVECPRDGVLRVHALEQLAVDLSLKILVVRK